MTEKENIERLKTLVKSEIQNGRTVIKLQKIKLILENQKILGDEKE